MVEFGIHSRLRACALIGMLVRVQSGASFLSLFPDVNPIANLRSIVKQLLVYLIGLFRDGLPRKILDAVKSTFN